MSLKGLRVGFAITGSHCTIKQIISEVKRLTVEGAEVTPIISTAVDSMDTRFGSADHWKQELETLTGKRPIASIVDAEPVGPQKLFDVLVVAPCTGNTVAKFANAITDTPVLMACKAHLRNQRPIVLAISTNDGLGLNARNIGVLLATKNIYMVPFGQDSPKNKANSLVAHMNLIVDTITEALQSRQIQPILREHEL
ncbi:MAG TPA: dipicolinate synthase subunit B [Desulfobacteria bacterium]|nr:dipicolinate synthase subunit B [Desulfobacteria bacterium]